MSNKTAITLSVVTAILLVVVVYAFYTRYSASPGVATATPETGFLADVSFGVSGEKESSSDGAAPTTSQIPSSLTGGGEFSSDEYGFRFRYPAGFTVSEFDDRGGHMVLVRAGKQARQQAQQQGKKLTSFQIFITPYDEPAGSLTKQRIKKDLPDLVVKNEQQFRFGNNISGLAFVSESEQFGKSREVWFVRDKHLYQVSTYLQSQKVLQDVLQTWRFK